MVLYPSVSSTTFVDYNTTSIFGQPPETKEDKSKKILQQVDDRERLCDLLKLVKQGKIKIDEAVDKIQEDEQFNRSIEPSTAFQWHHQDPIYTNSPSTGGWATGTSSSGSYITFTDNSSYGQGTGSNTGNQT